MRRKHITPIVVLMLVAGAFLYAASGRMSATYMPLSVYETASEEVAEPEPVVAAASQIKPGQRGMVDMFADDSYLIEKGDSTIVILVGNFAAHHNGAVILADSAVRYANQSFECFGHVLINQNTTYVYGERAQYNHNTCIATVFSDIVKIVDGEAVMYTYHCEFDTYDEVGTFYGGCYVEKGESLMESERGFYNTKTHDLIAVDNVEMRDETYQMTGDSVIFNTQTENAQYFLNTNIWNDKDEYLYADDGMYIKELDLHHLKRNAYLLSSEHEIWSDTIEYYRTDGHIIGRGNIQLDDTTQKILGFADYGEWWDEPGNAFFTRRPSMINYDPSQTDSLFLCADTLWMYTISAFETIEEATRGEMEERANRMQRSAGEAAAAMDEAVDAVEKSVAPVSDAIAKKSVDVAESAASAEMPLAIETTQESVSEESAPVAETQPAEEVATEPTTADNTATEAATIENVGVEGAAVVEQSVTDTATSATDIEPTAQSDVVEVAAAEDAVATAADSKADKYESKRVADSLKRVQRDALVAQKRAKRAERDSLKMAIRAERDSLLAIERAERDSLLAIEQAERDSIMAIERAVQDSIKQIKDSLLRMKIDTIIAERRERNIRIYEAEQDRIKRAKQKSEERRRRKIDRAKARALKRGKVYTGEDYTIDSLATDSINDGEPMRPDSLARDTRDTMARDLRDTMARDSLADSLAMDSTLLEPAIPADSVYKLIKAYRRVKMYRSDSQVVCDSLSLLNTDSVIRLYIDPIMWNDKNQITSDSMALYTQNQAITKAHFMGDPILGSEIDTMYYNQVKGKDMVALFRDGSVYRNDVDGNAQTIYYMQEEENTTDVTGFMYIESAGITFYLNEDGEMDKITYRQNPEYVLYPMDMIPETQERELPDFKWHSDIRPVRNVVFDRRIRATRRDDATSRRKPTFPITERINYDRRRLVENRMWVDRLDELSPEVVEWRNSRPSYKK